MQSNEERLKAALQQAIALLEAAQTKIQRLTLANALLGYRRKRGRPRKAGAKAASGLAPGRRARYSDDDLAAVAECVPSVRKQAAYREWLAQHDRRDSKTSALTYLLAVVYPGRGLRSSRAFYDVPTLRRRLSDWEKKRAK